MRRTDRELTTKEELTSVLSHGKIVQIAFVDEIGEPYIVTLNYGFVWDEKKLKLFFHSAREGRKINCIKNNSRVCFTVAICDPLVQGENACDYGMKFRSVVGYGRIKIIEEEDERNFGLNLVMRKYSGKGDWVFDVEIMQMTAVLCLEVDEITGKSRK